MIKLQSQQELPTPPEPSGDYKQIVIKLPLKAVKELAKFYMEEIEKAREEKVEEREIFAEQILNRIQLELASAGLDATNIMDEVYETRSRMEQ